MTTFKASLSIEGMFCGACVGNVTRNLEELFFVTTVNVDLLTNSAVVVFQDKDNIGLITEKIEDLGFESVVVSIEAVTNGSVPSQQAREVEILVSGMFDDSCPKIIEDALRAGTDNRLDILQLPTIKHPHLTIKTQPGLPVRRVISIINAIDTRLQASIYHAPTIEERSRQLQRRHQKHIIHRLIFTSVIAIPTFFIGVVVMSILPSTDPIREWSDQPAFGGNATRLDWALFFITTPVMFFGADTFHTHAFKGIRAMWSRKSSIPILRRFYRFGSMDLLISAGTSVAYFSSVAILIMNAAEKPDTDTPRRAMNLYFDSVTFLTFFILIGRSIEAYSKAKTGNAVSMLSSLRPTEALLLQGDLTNLDSTSTLVDPSSEKVPSTATTTRIPVDQLEVGDAVLVPHGSSPPTDGIISKEGAFLFDESSMTGESIPVPKKVGDKVYAGSVNVSGPVSITVTDIGGSSMLDQIVDVVRKGQAKRAPIERVADQITGYFVPVITLIAIVTWVTWLCLGQSGVLPRSWLDIEKGGWPFWSLEFAIAVFVVACPCGIGLAAPTALFVGGGLAAKNGILVHGGGEAFQEASRLKAVVFDKTGTLTEGKMRVTAFERIRHDDVEDDRLDSAILAFARALEEASTHPIAKAIVDYCKDTEAVVVEDISEILGQGMKGVIARKSAPNVKYEVAIGNESLFDSVSTDEGRPLSVRSTSSGSLNFSRPFTPMLASGKENLYLRTILAQHQVMGESTAIFAMRRISDESINGRKLSLSIPFRPLAIFAITDPIRAEAPVVLESLRGEGLEVYMCTGDNQSTARAIASQLNIPVANVRAGVLPQDKAAFIRELQHLDAFDAMSSNMDLTGRIPKGKRPIVAFVGDGTNDTPALSAADVSIALSSGSDIAMTTASFILLNSDLTNILTLFRLARRVFHRVKLNFAWAAVYNLALVPVAAGAFYAIGATQDHGGWRFGPVFASIAMAASSISVVLSSLALRLPEMTFRRQKPSTKRSKYVSVDMHHETIQMTQKPWA